MLTFDELHGFTKDVAKVSGGLKKSPKGTVYRRSDGGQLILETVCGSVTQIRYTNTENAKSSDYLSRTELAALPNEPEKLKTLAEVLGVPVPSFTQIMQAAEAAVADKALVPSTPITARHQTTY